MAHGGKALSTAAAEAAAREAGRLLFAAECRFIAGAATLDSLPEIGLPEVAFAGRSNVGKSSLVNALTGRRTLARVSHTPGRTQQINFFDLGGRLVLVDLPGYGYAQVGRTRVKRWSALIDAYLKGRPTLRRVCLLIDARHGAKESDRDMMTALDAAAVGYQAVLTKVDQLSPAALTAAVAELGRELAAHVAAHPEVLATSARGGLGIERLRGELAALASPARIG